jgi:hypothetical protein
MDVDTCSLAPGMKRMAGPSQRPSNRIFVPRMREYGQSFMRALTMTSMSTRVTIGSLMRVSRHTGILMSAGERGCLAMESLS